MPEFLRRMWWLIADLRRAIDMLRDPDPWAITDDAGTG